MSNSTTLASIRTDIARSQIALIVIGNAGFVLSYLVLTANPSRRTPCILYLLAYMISHFILINHTIVMSTLNLGFNIDPSVHSPVYCRLKFYLSFVFGTLPTYFLIMASFDRALISSPSVQIRRRSTRRLAFAAIIVLTLFWFLFHLHAFFYVDIFRLTSLLSICRPATGSYTSFIAYYALIVIAILPTCLLTIFAVQTSENMRQMRRNERYLIVILFIQILFYLITHGPLLGLSIYLEITKGVRKSIDQLERERFVTYLVEYLNFVHVAFSPLVNLISKNFRTKSKHLLSKIRLRRTRSNDTQS
jgi:hypothetical protein